jgi:hypothetical protein
MKILQTLDGVWCMTKELGLEKSEPVLLANGDLESTGNVAERISSRGEI